MLASSMAAWVDAQGLLTLHRPAYLSIIWIIHSVRIHAGGVAEHASVCVICADCAAEGWVSGSDVDCLWSDRHWDSRVSTLFRAKGVLDRTWSSQSSMFVERVVWAVEESTFRFWSDARTTAAAAQAQISHWLSGWESQGAMNIIIDSRIDRAHLRSDLSLITQCLCSTPDWWPARLVTDLVRLQQRCNRNFDASTGRHLTFKSITIDRITRYVNRRSQIWGWVPVIDFRTLGKVFAPARANFLTGEAISDSVNQPTGQKLARENLSCWEICVFSQIKSFVYLSQVCASTLCKATWVHGYEFSQYKVDVKISLSFDRGGTCLHPSRYCINGHIIMHLTYTCEQHRESDIHHSCTVHVRCGSVAIYSQWLNQACKRMQK